MLGVHDNFVGNQVSGVETHAELANHGNVGAGLESFHESFGSGLGNGTQVVDQIGLGHANTGVNDGEGLGFPVWDDLDEELLLRLELGGIGKGFIPEKNFVKLIICETFVTQNF